MFEGYPDILTIQELCKALHIGKNTAYNLIKNETIKSIRIGKSHKIPKVWLIEYINKVA